MVLLSLSLLAGRRGCGSSSRVVNHCLRQVKKGKQIVATTTTTTTTTARRRCLSTSTSSSSPWESYEMAPFDPIIGLNEEFKLDDYPNKVIVGVGAYRDNEGKPYTLPCVREAEKIIYDQNLDMEYSGIAGDPDFVHCALEFAYGKDAPVMQEQRVGGIQALSGTGGLRVFGELIKKHGHSKIYIPNPSWGNHVPIFRNSGLEVEKYRYYDFARSDLDFDGMMEDIANIPKNSCILLHSCAHNPTGMDPTTEQWHEISNLTKKNNLLVFFDSAYQGFASGDPSIDAASLRIFVENEQNVALIQSFSKNCGLYGHRVGALSVVGNNPDEVQKVVSQMKLVVRPMYSNPPRHGARIVSTILSDPKLSQDFNVQCKAMADRINSMRTLLQSKLVDDCQSTHNWDHITKQIGMFAYSGLSKEQVMTMREKHHVYCTADGRISMAGVTSGNVDLIANAIHDVSK